jgi:perosamine synthetase
LTKTGDLAASVISAVRRVIPGSVPAALHEPEFRGREWDYVKSCLDDGWVSSAGPFVGKFESDIARVMGRTNAIACVNGTAALQMALTVVGVSPGDEVLVPALTFVATINSVYHCGAIPHFVDCDDTSFGICPEALARYLADVAGAGSGEGCINRRTGRPIRAMVPVHIFGHPARMPELGALAKAYGLGVVEDATEALGSRSDDRPVGRHGDFAVLSFNGNKIVTTGGGGALVTDNVRFAQRARHITTTAKQPHRWAFLHDEVGYNFRMPNINAALGCAQIERLDDFVTRKRCLAASYEQAFEDVPQVSFFRERPGTTSNYWLNAILLKSGFEQSRDDLLDRLNDAGLQSRPAWNLMHTLPFNRNCPRAELPVSEWIFARLINLPSSPRLAD